MTRKRCPKGSRLNKKTKRCNKIKTLNVKKASVKKTTAKKATCPPCPSCPPCPTCPSVSVKKSPTPPKMPKQPSPTKITQKRKRCPKGTRKNKKTGLCEALSVMNVLPDVPINSNVIDVPPVENIEELGKVVHKTVESLKMKKDELLNTVNTPSFTPDASRELVSLNMKTPSEVMAYKCFNKEQQENLYDGLSIEDMKDILKHDQHFDYGYLARISKTLNLNDKQQVLKKLVKIAKNNPEINLVRIKMGNTGTDKDYKCVDWKDEKVKKIMLDNLNSKKEIDFSKIVGPQQYLSNCWFNTAMMCFFISDKGRKFTRSMREDMIKGNISTDITKMGAIIKTKRTLFMFNLIIDNALRGILDIGINTNYIIQGLHNVNQLSKHFIKPGKASNPVSFLTNLGLILHQPKLYMKKHTIIKVDEEAISNFKEDFINKYVLYSNFSPIPDVFFVELYDNNPFATAAADLNIKGKMLGLDWTDSSGKKHAATYTMTFDTHPLDGDKINYKLDSAVLRSNNKKHFVSFITGNGKEYRFDGHTKSHLQPFEWKKLLNKNKNFNFKKDETPNHWKGLTYNFSKAYQLLFYYRV